MSCAAERRPPSSGYLLFDDQPASSSANTPSDEMAMTNRSPMSRSVMTSGSGRERSAPIFAPTQASGAQNDCDAQPLTSGPMGNTETARKAGMIDSTGASVNTNLLARE